MGVTSTSVESPFAVAVAKAIFQWRDDNNLPTDGNVDLPMRRCSRDDRYETVYPGDKLPEKRKSKRVLEVDADIHMNAQTPPHKKERREILVQARRCDSPDNQEAESLQIQKMLLEFMAKMEYNNRITDQKIQALTLKFDEQEQIEDEEEEKETSAEEEEDWLQPPTRPSEMLQVSQPVETDPDCQVQDEILDESFWASKDFELEYESSDRNKGRIPLGKAWSS
ncbi:unnamed protein product, partial [Rotaria magnacalcarata]